MLKRSSCILGNTIIVQRRFGKKLKTMKQNAATYYEQAFGMTKGTRNELKALVL